MIEEISRKIPLEYKDEFVARQITLIKKRVTLFCVLTIATYFFAVLMGVIIYPGDDATLEIALGVMLIIAGILLLYLNRRASYIFAAKLNAYIFTLFLLSILVSLSGVYGDDATTSSAIFVFTMFFVSITIPWKPREIIVISFMHMVAYTSDFFYVRYLTGDSLGFGIQQYMDGFIFLIMTFILCIIIRLKETVRDIKNFMLLKEVENKSRQMRKELELATHIQKTLVPPSISTDKIDIAVSYYPASFMGGDYGRFSFIDDERLLFIISDVTGHGVSAALLVNRIHAEFERFAKEEKEPGILMRELNNFIKKDFEGTEMYLSAFCGMLDLGEMSLKYSNYGHPAQYVYHAKNKENIGLSAQTSLLGLPEEDSNTYQDTIAIGHGDRILLFTDGLTETVNKDNEQWGTERVSCFLKENASMPVNEFNNKLMDELNMFKEGKYKDDIFILNIDIKCIAMKE